MPFEDHRSAAPSTRRAGAILTSALVFLAWVAPLAAQAPQAPQAADEELPAPTGPLTVEQQRIEIGELVSNIEVPHEWTVQNTSDQPVTIERVTVSPGCEVLSFDPIVPGGGSTDIRTQVDTGLLTGRASCLFGVYTTGDDGDPSLLLSLGFQVVPRLLATPGYARWIYVQHEPEGTIAQTIFPADGAEFDVLSATAPLDTIDLSFREAKPTERRQDAKGSQWILEATLRETSPVGPIEGRIVIETTHPEQKTLTIPVSGFVRPVLFVQPSTGQFGTLEPGAPRHAVFDVRNFATEEIRLTGVAADMAGVSPSIRAVEEGRRYRLDVVFDPDKMSPGPFSGTLQVTTDSEHVPTLEVEFSGRLAASEGASDTEDAREK